MPLLFRDDERDIISKLINVTKVRYGLLKSLYKDKEGTELSCLQIEILVVKDQIVTSGVKEPVGIIGMTGFDIWQKAPILLKQTCILVFSIAIAKYLRLSNI
jgi:hypothetical protein